MSSFVVKGADRILLSKAIRQGVEDYFVGLSEPHRSAQWLRPSNRYRLRCTKRYEQDIKASLVDDRSLTNYVSASVPTHVIDGWSFFSRAVDATLRGDAYSAVHFSYYAELRAAMGLLAAEGVGIFNMRHPILKQTGKAEPFPKKTIGTHKVIWPVLRHWSSLQRAADLLDELVKPNSIRLSDWLEATKASLPTRAIAQKWLKSWGLDLATVEDDHDNRNLASYRPSELRRTDRLDVHEVIQFVEQLWSLFEPGSERRFPNIERLLVRSAWRQSRARPEDLHGLNQIGLLAPEVDDWREFFQTNDDPEPLRLAEKWSSIESPHCHLQMISRAALLLFVATSAARRLLVNAKYETETLSFWWKRHGEDRGFWRIGSALGNPHDYWADISTALDESRAWRTNNPSGSTCLRDWRRTQTDGLNQLGNIELIGIWGLIP